jgi:hypothetical protein
MIYSFVARVLPTIHINNNNAHTQLGLTLEKFYSTSRLNNSTNICRINEKVASC